MRLNHDKVIKSFKVKISLIPPVLNKAHPNQKTEDMFHMKKDYANWNKGVDVPTFNSQVIKNLKKSKVLKFDKVKSISNLIKFCRNFKKYLITRKKF